MEVRLLLISAIYVKLTELIYDRCYYMTGKCLAKIGRPPRVFQNHFNFRGSKKELIP